LLIEFDGHFRALNEKGAGGTNSRAGPAMCASLFAAFNFLIRVLDANILILQILNAVPEIFFVSGKFKDHDAFFAWEHGGVQNIECQIVNPGKLADNRLLHFRLGKSQYQNLRIHFFPP
jgi:hypothetical protein